LDRVVLIVRTKGFLDTVVLTKACRDRTIVLTVRATNCRVWGDIPGCLDTAIDRTSSLRSCIRRAFLTKVCRPPKVCPRWLRLTRSWVYRIGVNCRSTLATVKRADCLPVALF
jgi:hypothetical protein